MTILACDSWRTNAHLIEAVAELYLAKDDVILDLTYGRGVWWKRWWPHALMSNDNDVDTSAMFHQDFRSTTFAEAYWDVVAFDPPYVAIGGRKGSKMASLHAAFGLIDAPKSPKAMQEELINPGLTEAARLVRRGGLVLVKCQSYVSSGKLWPGTFLTWQHAQSLGLQLVDEFVHCAGVRPQPTKNRDGSERRQVHARRNTSTLFVFRRPLCSS